MATVIECVSRNDPAGLRLVIAQAVDVNERDSDGRTALMHAVLNNCLEIARLLLDSGAQVDAQDDLGNTALHYAAQEHNPDMASLLIEVGKASVDMEDNHGNTPLWRAVFNSQGRGDLISILLHSGAKKDHRNKYGKTPISLAKTIANYNIIQFFDS